MNIIPLNFNPLSYKKLNNDLKNMNNEEELINHYINYGHIEGRIYKIIIPNDFNFNNYRTLNYDLRNMNNEELENHYINYGHIEERIYKIKLPNDFNFNDYRELNTDLKNMNNEELENHYINYGYYENKNYKLNNGSNIKISIVMAYYNRKEQTIITLNQFELLYLKYNIEVIIIDDNSNIENNLDSIIYNYTFKIKLIKLLKKFSINPVIAYNLGLSFIEGDIIILQNPEIFHCNDILEYLLSNIKENYYFTFPVFSSPSFKHNEIIKNLQKDNCSNYYLNFIEKINYKDFDFDYNYYKSNYNDISELNYEDAYNNWISYGIKENRICNNEKIYYDKHIINNWHGWYNHYRFNKRNLHFLSAFKSNLLDKIGGFCNNFKDGLWYDDDDFINRISKIANIKSVKTNKYIGIHLYHLGGTHYDIFDKNFDKLLETNKNIYENNIKNNIIYCNKQFDNLEYNIINNF